MGRLDGDGRTVTYREWGAGAPVWLLHSGCGAAVQWRSVGELLAPNHHVVASDLCGAGETGPWQDVEPFRLETEAEAQELLLSRFSEPVHLVGHSYGGLVALTLAARAPGRFASLSLFEPPFFSLLRAGDPELYAETVDETERYLRCMRAGDFAGAAQSLMELTMGPRAWGLLATRFRDEAARRAPMGLKEHEAILALPEHVEGAAGLQMPIQVLTGGQSRPVLQRTAELLLQAFPRASHQVLPLAGHMGPLTHPRLFVEALTQHFQRGR